MQYGKVTSHRIEETNLGSRALFYINHKFVEATVWYSSTERLKEVIAQHCPKSKLEFVI